MQSLEEEVETWESFDGIDALMPPSAPPAKATVPAADGRQASTAAPIADDTQDSGMAKGSKRKGSSKREKKRGSENSQEQGNGMRSETLASI